MSPLLPGAALDGLPGSQGVREAMDALVSAVDAARGVHGCLVAPMLTQGIATANVGLVVMIGEEAARLGRPSPLASMLGPTMAAQVAASPIPPAFLKGKP